MIYVHGIVHHASLAPNPNTIKGTFLPAIDSSPGLSWDGRVLILLGSTWAQNVFPGIFGTSRSKRRAIIGGAVTEAVDCVDVRLAILPTGMGNC